MSEKNTAIINVEKVREENKALVREASPARAYAEKFEVTSEMALVQAAEFMAEMDGRIKGVRAKLDPIVSDAHKAHKALTALRAEMLSVLEEPKAIMADKVSAYHRKQALIQAEARRKAEEEARKAEEKRRQELEAQAQRWDDKGNSAKAQERRELAEQVFVAPTPVMTAPPKTVKTAAGSLTMIKDISVDIIDPRAVLQAVLDGKLPISCVEIKPGEIKKIAKSYGYKGREIPGVVIQEDFRTSMRKAS